MQDAKWRRPPRGRGLVLMAGGLALLGLTACDLVTGTDPPEEARVELTGSGVEAPVEIIISNSFVPQGMAENILLVEADTAFVELPFEGVYPFGESRQFLVQVPSPEDHDPTLAIRVLIDGRESHFQEQVMDGGLLQFHYTRW
jgi:hypothetical protein